MVSNSFMIAGVVTGVLSTLLTGVTLISASSNVGVLHDLHWSEGYWSGGGNSFTIYVGVYEFGFYVANDDTSNGTINYSDNWCNIDLCDKCSTNMQAVIAFVAIFFLASIPALASAIMRYRGTSNNAIMKWVGVIFNILCILSGAIGLITFAAGCEKYFVDEYDNGVNWTYGPSFGMLAAATCFKFVELIFCFLVGTDNSVPAASQNQV